MIFNTIEKELANFYQLNGQSHEKCQIGYGTKEQNSKMKAPQSTAFTPSARHSYILPCTSRKDKYFRNPTPLQKRKITSSGRQQDNVNHRYRHLQLLFHEDELIDNKSKSQDKDKLIHIQAPFSNKFAPSNSSKDHENSKKMFSQTVPSQLSSVRFHQPIKYQDKLQNEGSQTCDFQVQKQWKVASTISSSLIEKPLPPQQKQSLHMQKAEVNVSNLNRNQSQKEIQKDEKKQKEKIYSTQTFSQKLWIVLFIMAGLVIVVCRLIF